MDNILPVHHLLQTNDTVEQCINIMHEVFKYLDEIQGNPAPCRNSTLSGYNYIIEIINSKTRCYEFFWLSPQVFISLCERLKLLGLQESRNVTVLEQVGIFLLTLSHNIINWVSAERFRHSTETISRHFHNVLDYVQVLAAEIIVPPDFTAIPDEIRLNPKFWPYFKNCVGAIDGTHIHAQIPLRRQTPFRSGKGDTTQNIMAVCSFDLKFTFVLAGWEGSANDSRILNECLADETLGFPNPPDGKYYLVDSGYANRPDFLAPYRGYQYHLQDFRRSRRNPRNKEEAFNYKHSALRNAIERCFGLLKMRFSILKQMPGYKFKTQVSIVTACCTLHNFIRMQSLSDIYFDDVDDIDVDIDADHTGDNPGSSSRQNQMDTVRNEIANDIFTYTVRT